MIESVIGGWHGGVRRVVAVLPGYRATGAAVRAPTDLRLALARSGALRLRITVRGKPTDGCLQAERVLRARRVCVSGGVCGSVGVVAAQ